MVDDFAWLSVRDEPVQVDKEAAWRQMLPAGRVNLPFLRLHRIPLEADNQVSVLVVDDRDVYVNVPLEATYQAAYRGMPQFWREILEQPAEPG